MPLSGRIGKSNVTEGAIVTAYQPIPSATIQQLDPIYVDVPQSTAELLQLKRRLAEGRLNRNGTEQTRQPGEPLRGVGRRWRGHRGKQPERIIMTKLGP